MQQLSLFDAPQILLGDYYRLIEKAAWADLPQVITSLDNLGIIIPNWEEKKEFWAKNLSELDNICKCTPEQLARYWEKLFFYNKLPYLKTEFLFIEKYLFQQILKKLEGPQVDYVTENLHPVYCHLKLENFSAAIELAEFYCSNKNEDSKLRTYQSYCLCQIKKKNDAMESLTFALFFNPLQVDKHFIFNKDIVRLLSALKTEYQDSDLRIASLPFEAWIDSLVEIPFSIEFVNRIKAIYQYKIYKHDTPTALDRQIYFNHLIYIAEYKRKISHLVDNELIGFRKHLKNVDEKSFGRYINRIS